MGFGFHLVLIVKSFSCESVKDEVFLENIDALDWYIDILQDPEMLCSQIVGKFIDIHELNGENTTKRLIDEQQKLYKIICKNMKAIKRILEGQS